MKRKGCLSILLIGIQNNNLNKKKLVQFTKHIGKPISYPKYRVYGTLFFNGTTKERVNKAFPLRAYTSVEELMLEVWLIKN
jgi:hypothetical protein